MRILGNKKRLVTTLIGAVVLVGAATGLSLFLNQPADGVVVRPTSDQSENTEKPTKSLTSAYFNASYPGRYEPANDQAPSASLKTWTFTAHQQSTTLRSAKLSIIVTNLPAGGAKEDSAYKLFNAFPDKYKLTTDAYSGETVYVANHTDTDGYQQTVLWAHAKYLLTVTATAAVETDSINGDLKLFLSSVEWLQ